VVILDGGVVVVDGNLAELRGGGEELVVELDGRPEDADRLVAHLRAAGVSATVDAPRRVVVALEAPAVYDIVRDAIADCGLGLRRLQKRMASLEEVYLEAAGRAAEQARSAGAAR